MAQPIPASLIQIVPVVKAQLVKATGVPDNLIRFVAKNQIPRFQGDHDILLRGGGIQWDKGFDVGSGRVCAIIRRPLLVRVRTRCNLDLSDQDDSRMLDPTLGHVPLEESAANALYDFVPQDANGNMLVQEPMHPVDYPEEEAQEGQAADWAESLLAFQLTYQLPLNQDPSYG